MTVARFSQVKNLRAAVSLSLLRAANFGNASSEKPPQENTYRQPKTHSRSINCPISKVRHAKDRRAKKCWEEQ
jgi:hypothetical protein